MRRAGRRVRAQCLEQRPQFQPCVQFAQAGEIRRTGSQTFGSHVQGERRVDGGELARQLENRQFAAQILAHLAADLRRVRDQLIQRLILVEPFGSGLGADAGDARNVVRAVADQRQVVDDLLGIDIEFCLDAVAVQARVAHGIDQSDLGTHQLRHVLVAGGDQHVVARGGSLLGQGANDIIGLDTGHAQQRQPHGGDGVVQRLYLRAQVVGHGLTMRLVLLEQIVSEGAARRIEHHRDAIGGLLL
jgi:hypothetical protein